MSDKQTLLDLANRVEAGDVVRDTEIVKALGICVPRTNSTAAMIVCMDIVSRVFDDEDIPQGFSFTRHLDAAKALQERTLPCWHTHEIMAIPADNHGNGKWLVQLNTVGKSEYSHFATTSLPRAWVAAILRAKASEVSE